MSGALELSLAELLSMQPRRVGSHLAPGQRIPGGERKGIVRTQGTDFESISPYSPGDDVRRIDWGATARSGQTQMRRMAATAYRARCIVLNLSDDTIFGTSGRIMAKTAALTAAMKCWEAQSLNEPVGLALGVEPELALPRRGQRHTERLIEALWRRYRAIVQGETGPQPLRELIYMAAGRLRRRDELCVIDEFAEINPEFRKLSSGLAEQRALHAVVLADPMTLHPLPAGHYAFVSGQDDAWCSVDLDERAAQKSSDDFKTLRRAQRGELSACGWHVTYALDMLPLHDREYGAGK